jgi:hypothetical protein
VSRRKERARRAEAGAARGEAGGARRGEAGGARSEASAARGGTAARWSLPAQIALLVAVFALVTLVAELAGAANLGVSFGIGQIAFAIAVAYLLIRR